MTLKSDDNKMRAALHLLWARGVLLTWLPGWSQRDGPGHRCRLPGGRGQRLRGRQLDWGPLLPTVLWQASLKTRRQSWHLLLLLLTVHLLLLVVHGALRALLRRSQYRRHARRLPLKLLGLPRLLLLHGGGPGQLLPLRLLLHALTTRPGGLMRPLLLLLRLLL